MQAGESLFQQHPCHPTSLQQLDPPGWFHPPKSTVQVQAAPLNPPAPKQDSYPIAGSSAIPLGLYSSRSSSVTQVTPFLLQTKILSSMSSTK